MSHNVVGQSKEHEVREKSLSIKSVFIHIFLRLLATTSVLICTSVAILTWLCIIDDSSNLVFILEGNTTVPILKDDFQPFNGLKLGRNEYSE